MAKTNYITFIRLFIGPNSNPCVQLQYLGKICVQLACGSYASELSMHACDLVRSWPVLYVYPFRTCDMYRHRH